MQHGDELGESDHRTGRKVWVLHGKVDGGNVPTDEAFYPRAWNSAGGG